MRESTQVKNVLESKATTYYESNIRMVSGIC